MTQAFVHTTEEQIRNDILAAFRGDYFAHPTRDKWCEAQIHVCAKLCGDDAIENTCNTRTLFYECICAAKAECDCDERTGERWPLVSLEEDSLPRLICEEWETRCPRGSSFCGDVRGSELCYLLSQRAEHRDEVIESLRALPKMTATREPGTASTSPPQQGKGKDGHFDAGRTGTAAGVIIGIMMNVMLFVFLLVWLSRKLLKIGDRPCNNQDAGEKEGEGASEAFLKPLEPEYTEKQDWSD